MVKVKSAAICGTDIRMYRNGAKGIDESHPLVLGHEISGVIEKVGSKVQGYKAGMRVAVAPNMGCGICEDCVRGNSHMCKSYRALGINLDGGFAEYVKIPESAVRAGNIIEIAEGVSHDEAAIAEALSCVHNGSSQCNIRPGDFVLIVGAGPIGIMHAMMAKMAGAGKIIVNDISQERLEYVKKLDPFYITVKDDVENFVVKETNSHGMDVVITACPVPAAQQMALRVAANYGRVCFFGGLPADKQEVLLNSNLIHYKQLIVTGTTRASLYQFRQVLGFISSGIFEVNKLITKKVSIDEIADGFAAAINAEGLKNIVVME